MAGLAGKWASGSDSSSESEGLSDEGSEVSITPKTPSGMFEKDSDEEELERLVLGDKASFRENLFKNDLVLKGQDTDDVQMDDVDTGGLEDVDDADLFVVDTVAGAGNSGTIATKEPSATALKNAQGDAPAWEDSDDDRLVVSLARNTKMRRLRLTADDDLVSGTEYSRRLRQQFLRVHPAPSWVKDATDRSASRRRRRSSAGSSGSDSDSSENEHGAASAEPLEEFLRSVKQLAGVGASKKHRLRPEVIDIQKTHNIPDKHKMPVECLSFHPEYPVLLSASTATILHLHHIAPDAQPTPNPRLTSVQIKQVDVRQAQFLYPQGDKIYFAGRRGYFHHWDLPSGIVQKTEGITGRQMEYNSMDRFKLSPCGRYMAIVATARKGSGVINILNVTTSQWIAAARLSSRNGIADFAWWSTGDGMTILGRDGQVGEYSMVSRGFVGIWNDDGCLGGIVIALGGHGGPAALGEDRWVAVGSNTGITNIYERSTLIESQTPDEVDIKDRPQPTRTFEHLITPITVVTFSPDGQLLAFGSRAKVDALKLVHLPSCTVYRNWPTQKTPLGRVTCVAFGRKSDLLAIGDDIGRIKLWHIRR
ncbi:WD domain, G-beta repeat containing protein [Moelleriella libera RCEF 2490]|uniref:WD domain, G-beta repeat containing protein n=1 Tax=Moelleriella libera RCEF 2490 TaxID=1081109 RepID=A0A166RNB2_9HYPO|nr:WD domain, G-beta repeat containing protein [Moelleriella libera RCEF 2490]